MLTWLLARFRSCAVCTATFSRIFCSNGLDDWGTNRKSVGRVKLARSNCWVNDSRSMTTRPVKFEFEESPVQLQFALRTELSLPDSAARTELACTPRSNSGSRLYAMNPFTETVPPPSLASEVADFEPVARDVELSVHSFDSHRKRVPGEVDIFNS